MVKICFELIFWKPFWEKLVFSKLKFEKADLKRKALPEDFEIFRN